MPQSKSPNHKFKMDNDKDEATSNPVWTPADLRKNPPPPPPPTTASASIVIPPEIKVESPPDSPPCPVPPWLINYNADAGLAHEVETGSRAPGWQPPPGSPAHSPAKEDEPTEAPEDPEDPEDDEEYPYHLYQPKPRPKTPPSPQWDSDPPSPELPRPRFGPAILPTAPPIKISVDPPPPKTGYSGWTEEPFSEVEIPERKATLLRGHDSDVIICAWNPTMDLLATGSKDATARIWEMSDINVAKNPNNGHILSHRTRGPTDISYQVSVSIAEWRGDGKLLATGSRDGFARIWNHEGKLLCTFSHDDFTLCAIKWNKRGDYFLTMGLTKIVLWCYLDYMECGDKTQEIPFPMDQPIGIDWQSDESFASCSSNGFINVWKIERNNPVKSFKGHADTIHDIKWDPHGNLLATCSSDMTTKIWMMTLDSCVHDLQAHSKPINKIEWSPIGRKTGNPNKRLILASGSDDCTVKLWDVERGRPIHNLTKHSKRVNALAFSPDGTHVASGSEDKFIYIWSTKTGQLVHSYEGTSKISHISWNHAGDKIAFCSINDNFVNNSSDNSNFVVVLDLR